MDGGKNRDATSGDYTIFLGGGINLAKVPESRVSLPSAAASS